MNEPRMDKHTKSQHRFALTQVYYTHLQFG
jgi:hypothetical protein